MTRRRLQSILPWVPIEPGASPWSVYRRLMREGPWTGARYSESVLFQKGLKGLRQAGREAYREGIRIGYEEGRAKGREQARREWTAWNNSRRQAQAEGRPFHEPPPSHTNGPTGQ